MATPTLVARATGLAIATNRTRSAAVNLLDATQRAPRAVRTHVVALELVTARQNLTDAIRYIDSALAAVKAEG